jgi:hypothetical protein
VIAGAGNIDRMSLSVSNNGPCLAVMAKSRCDGQVTKQNCQMFWRKYSIYQRQTASIVVRVLRPLQRSSKVR